MTRRRPRPDDFEAVWQASRSDRAIMVHYGMSNQEAVVRWRRECGLRRKSAVRRRPPNFQLLWSTGATDKALGMHYRAGLAVIERWRREVGLRRNTHGLVCRLPPTSYRQGARTEEAREAHRVAMGRLQEVRVRRTALNGGVAPVPQHNASTYSNWGCRCGRCVTVKSAANAAYKDAIRK